MQRELTIVDRYLYYRIWVISPIDMTIYCGFGAKKSDPKTVRAGFFRTYIRLSMSNRYQTQPDAVCVPIELRPPFLGQYKRLFVRQ